MRILVVEDEAEIGRAVAAVLADEGHAVDLVARGDEVDAWLDTYAYDLLVVDVVLPGLDGLAVTRSARARGLDAPILLLTALDDVADRVAGLDAGADDYLAKPFAVPELLARVRALRRRNAGSPDPVLRVGELELDPARRSVRLAGRPVGLTRREFALLEVLAREPGTVFSQDRLIGAVWNAEFSAESNVVEVHIRSLRRKLDAGRPASLIETVRGFGYRLSPPTAPSGAAPAGPSTGSAG